MAEQKKLIIKPCCCLMPMLEAQFYSACESHGSKNTFFCFDCIGILLCERCLRAKEHQPTHQIVQVFKASHQVAIRIDDLQKLVDISSIQPYINNDSRVVYIRQRRQRDELPNTSTSVPKCETCGWQLLPGTTSKFCSIQCKINGEGNSIKEARKIKCQTMLFKPVDFSPYSYRKRSKKGIPRRSPLF